MWSLQVCVCVIRRRRRWITFAKRVLPQSCWTLATAAPRFETSARSCSGDEQVDCVSLFFFPNPIQEQVFFFCRYCSFLLPTASWSHPAEPPPAPTEVFHETQTWEQMLQMKTEKSQVIITTTWVVDQGRCVSWAASRRRIRRSCAAKRSESLLMNFFFHVCDATTVTFCSWRDNDATVLIICVHSWSSSSAFFLSFLKIYIYISALWRANKVSPGLMSI